MISIRTYSKKLFWGLSVVLLFCLLGFFFRVQILTQIGRLLISETKIKPADTVFLLQGNFPKGALEAAQLIKEAKAMRILLTDERPLDGLKELREKGGSFPGLTKLERNTMIELGVQPDRIRIDPFSTDSTKQEIEFLRKYCASSLEHERIIVVARRFQTQRTQRLLKSFDHGRCDFQVTSSRYDIVREDNWWKEVWHLREGIYEITIALYNIVARFTPLEYR